jgi:hypothetical protein
LIVAVNYFTKWVEAEPIPSKENNIDAPHVATFIMRNIIARFGIPSAILSDQGREFCNELNDDLCARLNINRRIATAYHPQTNGLTERNNGTVTSILKKMCDNEEDNWAKMLPMCLLSMRTSRNRATGASPFQITYNCEPRLPVYVDYESSSESRVHNNKHGPVEVEHEYTNACEKNYQAMKEACKDALLMRKKAHGRIVKEQQKQKEKYDEQHTAPNYKIGDRVLVFNKRAADRKGDKLKRSWDGPFTVVTSDGIDTIGVWVCFGHFFFSILGLKISINHITNG